MSVSESGAQETNSNSKPAVPAESGSSSDSFPPLEDFEDPAAPVIGGTRATDVPGKETIPPGISRGEVIRPKRYGRSAAIILVLLAIVVSIAGLVDRYGLTNIVKSLPLGSQRSMTQVESHHGRILMLETHGDTSRVLVQTHGQASWQLVSKDDVTAVNPSLSPSSERVAYLSDRDDGSVVIVSLLDEEEHHITSEDIEDSVRKMPSAGTKVCSWTPISWDPDGHRVAFFGCREEPPLSIVVIADVSNQSPALGIVTGSDVATLSHRQVQWSSTTELTLSVIDGDAKLGHQIMTLAVPAPVTSTPSAATPTSPAPTVSTQNATTPVRP